MWPLLQLHIIPCNFDQEAVATDWVASTAIQEELAFAFEEIGLK